MRGVNKVIIVGNLGADPEVRQFSNGGMVANISVATSEQWTDKQTGEKKEATEWHRITFNNRLAEIAAQYLRKGSSVYVEGSLRTRKWQDQNGQDRYTTEIRAMNMQMLGGNPNAGMGGMGQPMGMGGGMPQGQAMGGMGAAAMAGGAGGFQNNQNSFQNAPQNQGGFQGQANSFQNQANSFNSPQPAPQQASAQPANPQGMAMQDAPADDDIPF